MKKSSVTVTATVDLDIRDIVRDLVIDEGQMGVRDLVMLIDTTVGDVDFTLDLMKELAKSLVKEFAKPYNDEEKVAHEKMKEMVNTLETICE